MNQSITLPSKIVNHIESESKLASVAIWMSFTLKYKKEAV